LKDVKRIAKESLKQNSFKKYYDSVSQSSPLSPITFWFNAWNYENSDQIWAGLIDTIIRQYVTRLDTSQEQEEFWLRLHLKRNGAEKVLSHFRKIRFESLLPVFFAGVILLLIAYFGSSVFDLAFESNVTNFVRTLSTLVALLITVAKLISDMRNQDKSVAENVLN
jgi:hypothetical protein